MGLCIIAVAVSLSSAAAINLNQVGFYPKASKQAVAVGVEADSFYVIPAGGTDTVYTGALGTAYLWDASNEQARILDFTSFTDTGSYQIEIAGAPASPQFRIADAMHHDVAKASIKAFYYNRSSFALDEKYAGVFKRAAGHPDTAVVIHGSAASDSRPEGTVLSSPGGWYDAGDYGKYIVNSGISTFTLMAAYEAFPDFYDTLDVAIPESDNKLPDLLDEALFNIRWMLTMQDPDDGGVYHKLTTANFCGMVMPDKDLLTRYVVKKSTAAALDFAAVCAQASRVYKKFDSELPGFADSCLAASLRAWNWARANPKQYYSNSDASTSLPKIVTGEYGDKSVTDEFTWAATELYIATKQDSFFTIGYPSGKLEKVSLPSWPGVAALGLYSMYLCHDSLSAVSPDAISAALQSAANLHVTRMNNCPYHVAMTKNDFYWGSNCVAANQGMVLALAYLATKEGTFKTSALNQLDYLLGRNPTGYSYVTGIGDKSPMFIHHRPSAADGIDEPVPGFLAGGPNSEQQDSAGCAFYTSSLPALSYLDKECSYASNEIAINWNASLVFLAGAVEALFSGDQTAGIKASRTIKRSKRVVPAIRLQHGHLQIHAPMLGESLVLVENLQGRMLAKKKFSGDVALQVTWPMQVVLVTVKPLHVSSLTSSSTQRFFTALQ